VIEVAVKPSRFERITRPFVGEYLNSTRGKKNILDD
jgi:hypothetical protein